MQQAVVEAGAVDLDVIGEAEAPLERAPRDAAVQVAALVSSSSFCALPAITSEFCCTVISTSSRENPATAMVRR